MADVNTTHNDSPRDPRRRERIAENTYRRLTKSGKVVFEVVFRDVDGRQRTRRLQARTERAAIREARGVLAGRIWPPFRASHGRHKGALSSARGTALGPHAARGHRAATHCGLTARDEESQTTPLCGGDDRERPQRHPGSVSPGAVTGLRLAFARRQPGPHRAAAT